MSKRIFSLVFWRCAVAKEKKLTEEEISLIRVHVGTIFSLNEMKRRIDIILEFHEMEIANIMEKYNMR